MGYLIGDDRLDREKKVMAVAKRLRSVSEIAREETEKARFEDML